MLCLYRFVLSLTGVDIWVLVAGTVARLPDWCLKGARRRQVHKFSKFIHGSATLLPDLVQAVPYWVDDESVRPSMLQSAPAPPPVSCAPGPRPRLPHQQPEAVRISYVCRNHSCAPGPRPACHIDSLEECGKVMCVEISAACHQLPIAANEPVTPIPHVCSWCMQTYADVHALSRLPSHVDCRPRLLTTGECVGA